MIDRIHVKNMIDHIDENANDIKNIYIETLNYTDEQAKILVIQIYKKYYGLLSKIDGESYYCDCEFDCKKDLLNCGMVLNLFNVL
jgi:hypothetical protein